MGKKIAIGAFGVFGVLFVAGGILAYIYVLRPARDAVDTARDLARLQALNEDVRAGGSFEAPTDSVLREGQVQRYLAVQADMQRALEGRVAELQRRYERFEEGGDQPGPGDVMRAWSDMTSLLVEAKEAQVAALNAHDFSLEEYGWVRTRVLHAAGVEAYGYDLTQVVAEAEGEGRAAAPAAPPEGVPPEANVTLVQPHVETVQEALPFALFGL